MKNIEKQLIEFLTKTKREGYADSLVKKIKEKDKSKTIKTKYGNWECHDNYFGGEPYGGREVVFYKKKPIYIIVYYGFVDKSVKDFKKVYGFLKEALWAKKDDNIIRRGPKKYINGNFTYLNNFKGKIQNFSGVEIIKLNGKQIYKAIYAGGLVDQRKELKD